MNKLIPAIVLIASTCNPAYSQGISEMGAAYGGMPRGGGMSNYKKTIDSLYNGGGLGRAMFGTSGGGNAGGGQRSGTLGAPSPSAHFSPEQISAYTAQVQRSYAAGLAAEKAGKKDEAVKQYGIALSIRERVWGNADPAIADIARKQAGLYEALGKSADAEASWRKVLASDQRHFGGGAPQLVKTLGTLASMADSRGDNREALNYYKQLFAIERKSCGNGPDNAACKADRLKVATLASQTGDFTTAETLLKEAVASQEASASPDKAYAAEVYERYAGLLKDTGRGTDAVAMESKAAALRGAGAPAAPAEAAPAATTPPASDTPAK